MTALLKAWEFLGIRGTIAILALALAGVQTWRLGNAQDEILEQRENVEEQRDKAAKCEARHEVTRNSVSRLESIIDELNEQAEQRAEAFAEAQELAAVRDKELAALERSTDQRIARLRELAGSRGQCATPAELQELAEGL